jgi:excisionase family DNA binding protein
MPPRKVAAQGVRENLLDGEVVSTLPDRTQHVNYSATLEASMSQPAWLTPKEAAQRARCGVKTIYREVGAGRLRAARVGGRRELRFKVGWVDEWLEATATLIEVAA